MQPEPTTRPLIKSSIELIQQHQAPTGAYLAAPGYGTYAYSWLRDGAFIAAAMDAHGHHANAAAFHTWAARTIESYAPKVKLLEAETDLALSGTGDPLRPLDDRYVLHTRFTIDGAESDSHWGNFQLDGYGFWLTSVTRHLEVTNTDPAPYLGAIDIVCRYLTLIWDRPCYDPWEEYPNRRHPTTWAAVARGLLHGGNLLADEATRTIGELITRQLLDHAGPHNTLRKFIPQPETNTVPATATATATPAPARLAVAGHERVGRPLEEHAIDGSALLVLGPFGPYSATHQIISGTLKSIEDALVVNGGVHRYLQDEYYGGGLWIVLAGALACAQAVHDTTRAHDTLDWIEAQADANGHLGEQTDTHLRHPDGLAPWIQRWGLPAKPLLWSHAMYLLGVAATRPGSTDPCRAPRP